MPVVRLGQPEIQAMRQRTYTQLTDEGAKNWYVNDVSALLEELDLLHTELAEIRESLINDGASPGASVAGMLEDWKLNCSGVFEKRTTKRLQHETREALKAKKAAEQAIEIANVELQALTNLANERTEQLEEAISARYDDAELHKAEMAARDETELELREELIEAKRNLDDSERRARQAVAVVSALEAERRSEIQERLREIEILIGG